jgi:hypothetical protein
MTDSEQRVEVIDNEFLTIAHEIHKSETEALMKVLNLIDGTLNDIGKTNICLASEMTDALLDMRNMVAPIIEARA